MQRNILKTLRKDWLVQEFAINLIQVPALAYFVWACFPFARENAVHFFGFITFALGGCFGACFAGRKIAARKMVRIFTPKRPSDPEELSAAKVQSVEAIFGRDFRINTKRIGYQADRLT